MIIRYRTRDDPPMIGEWIRSTRRPRWAYFVLGVRKVRGGVLGSAAVYAMTVERRPAQAPAAGDVVHAIYWDYRGRKRP